MTSVRKDSSRRTHLLCPHGRTRGRLRHHLGARVSPPSCKFSSSHPCPRSTGHALLMPAKTMAPPSLPTQDRVLSLARGEHERKTQAGRRVRQCGQTENCLHHCFFLARAAHTQVGWPQTPRARRAASCAAPFFAARMAPAPPTTSLHRAHTAWGATARAAGAAPARAVGGWQAFHGARPPRPVWGGGESTREGAHQCLGRLCYMVGGVGARRGGAAEEE